ncbi:RNA polymerase sigma factor [Marinigracilibium pacificum]|nr:hypothetical protein [Marinigracilibium pacificum]
MKQSLIWKNYHKPLFNFILFKVKDIDLAEDIMQNVWLTLLRSMLNQEKIDNLVIWLFEVASYEINSVNSSESDFFENSDSIKFLNTRQAVVSYLKTIQDIGINDIAEIVEEPTLEVEKLLHQTECDFQL